MGIQGLINFVNKATESVNVRDLNGKTAAVDSYCWLHRGTFSCAEKLAIGEKTSQHINYCLNFVKMLLFHNIKPIMIFDGQYLPAKREEESNRRKNRQNSRELAIKFLKNGDKQKARSYMASSVNITHEMALDLIQECRKLGVDSIVAPYEADAQLAYMNKIGLADYVITEDSDLILFGCEKILFKLQKNGDALLYDSDKLNLTMDMSKEKFNFDIFRSMCIISGCDYLPSLSGIGLQKAKRFVKRTYDIDKKQALKNIGQHLNMNNLTVTDSYIDNYFKAEATFQYQYVYDPLMRQLVRLNSLPDNFDENLLSESGELINENVAFQLALGNIDPFSKKQLAFWNPDSDLNLPNTSIWFIRSKRKIQTSEKIEQTIGFKIISKKSPNKLNFKSPRKNGPMLTKKRQLNEQEIEDLINNDDVSVDIETECESSDNLLENNKKIRLSDDLFNKKDALFNQDSIESTPSNRVRIFPLKEQILPKTFDDVIDKMVLNNKSSDNENVNKSIESPKKIKLLESKFLTRTKTKFNTSNQSNLFSSFFKRVEDTSVINELLENSQKENDSSSDFENSTNDLESNELNELNQSNNKLDKFKLKINKKLLMTDDNFKSDKNPNLLEVTEVANRSFEQIDETEQNNDSGSNEVNISKNNKIGLDELSQRISSSLPPEVKNNSTNKICRSSTFTYSKPIEKTQMQFNKTGIKRLGLSRKPSVIDPSQTLLSKFGFSSKKLEL